MTISEEILMAFADGELDDAAHAEVEAAMRKDPDVAERVERHRALRSRLQTAFAAELDEPVPPRLLSAVRDSPALRVSNVVDLKEARAASARAAQGRASSPRDAAIKPLQRAAWRQVGSIAAGVLLGLAIGYGMWKQGAVPIVRGASGGLIADGQLAAALSGQLAAEQTGNASVHIGVSYLSKSGDYCRSFALAGATPAAAAATGVACRDHQHWQIQALAQAAPQTGGDYRTAGTAISSVVLTLIEDDIQGEPLDAAGESAARLRGWQPPN
jgi:anti-sigma factor RsiW